MANAPRAATGPTHPLYDLWAPIWTLLGDCADGTGGFLDGTYLIPHPREWADHDQPNPVIPTKKLLERRRLARYEKIAGLVLTLKLDGLFREPATRRVMRPSGDAWERHPYLDWAAGDVDGTGRPIDAVLSATYRSALTYGHMFLALDRARDDGPTAADRAPLVLRTYRPTDAPDWIDVRGTLTAIKLVEALPRASLDDPEDDARWQVYRITETETRITTVTGEERTEQRVTHGFGVLPVVPLYAHRPSLTSILGESALSDPRLYVDLFNLTSEIRELLRKQTFSLLNIPLGSSTDGGPAISVEQAQAMLGQTTGTANVLFSALPANYISADTANVTVYQKERAELIRTIFRLCKVPYEQDSREAETAEAQREKRKDFSTTLAGYADRLREAELALAQRWYRGTFGADAWARHWEAGTPVVSYPQTFDEPAFAEVLEQAQAALALPLGESKTFRVEHASRLIAQFLPDATAQMLQTIRQELEQQPTPEEQRAERLDVLAARFRPDDADDTDDVPPVPDVTDDDEEA